MTTLKAIRQAVGQELNECLVGTVTDATTTTLTDTANLLDSSDDAARLAGAWVYIASGAQAGTTRRVLEFAPSTGTLTVDSWTAPAAGSEYELHQRLRPADLNRLINQALVALRYHTEQRVDVVAGQRQYSLADYAWLTEPRQVYAVCVEMGGEGARQYPDIPFEVTAGDEGLTLHVPPSATRSGEHLLLRCSRPYEALAEDADVTACPLDWVRTATVYRVYEWLCRHGPAQDTERYARDRAREGAKLAALNRRYYTLPARRQHSPYSLGV
jgi:hypothetical protein